MGKMAEITHNASGFASHHSAMQAPFRFAPGSTARFHTKLENTSLSVQCVAHGLRPIKNGIRKTAFVLAQRRFSYAIFCMAHRYREYPHVLL